MSPTTYGALFAGGLFAGMFLLLETGHRIGARRLARDPEGARQGLGVVEGAVFSLLGLLIAFTFSGAATRFDSRRHLITDEANDIGTAWLRLETLPSAATVNLRELFRQYLDSRIATYRKLPDFAAAKMELARSQKLQGEIWTNAVAACRETTGQPNPMMLLLPALNQMIDITTTRTEAAKIHPPLIIFVMLGLLSLASALLAGYGMVGGRSRSWIHIVSFAAVLALIVYVILDIEYPRLGFIQVSDADRVLIELRESMN